MAVPSILLQVITSNRPSQFDRPLQGPGILHVPHFQALSISVSRPVYQLRSLCEATGIKRIRFLSEDKNIEGFLQKYTKKKWSFDGKNKRFYVNLTKEGVIVEVKSSGDVSEQVIVDKIDERSTIFYPAITPCHFDDKLESTGAMNALIMKKNSNRKRC
ncbi:MAG: hypothetical protein HWD59_04535 [Coxiellaceae bacterium]|nr:MAG: hypothetical protein HWD59_04535 [Coxiellaceae bacterium]